jgi:putative transposase
MLKIKVGALFEANSGEYGYRRLHRALLRGEHRSPELVRQLMRELGLVPCQPRPWRHSLPEQDALAGDIPDPVSRDFTAERPDQKMVADITYIPTWQGWLYLATVIDCATRKIVGRAMDDNYKTSLIIPAAEIAARNMDLPDGAVL